MEYGWHEHNLRLQPQKTPLSFPVTFVELILLRFEQGNIQTSDLNAADLLVGGFDDVLIGLPFSFCINTRIVPVSD
jgi:hypothetical protein